MRTRRGILACAAATLLAAVSSARALSTREIEPLRGKTALSTQDMQLIDRFLAEGVQEILAAAKSSDMARIRTVILSMTGTSPQYAQQFSRSAGKHIRAALQSVAGIPEPRRTLLTVNLLILADGLGDVMLADIGIQMLADRSAIVRYWAVHLLTNQAVIDTLNSGDATTQQLATAIIGKLKTLIDAGSPEIVGLIARFAGTVKAPQAGELLLQIADVRIARYINWKVDYELLDGAILRLLAQKTTAARAGAAEFGRRFGQLYSCAIQRYLRGKNVLGGTQKQHLASMLVATEQESISKLLGAPQTAIKRAIERGDDAALAAQHDRLLGTDTAAGLLGSKFGFDYGTDSTGCKRLAPLPISAPPAPPQDR